ncbi:MAG: 3-phosphoglycerate dehydrogenase [Candidatus Omnitrophica bacterium]|nr:3-phosphoglycerate dehydrogenase [Candidatus Omnitrophota bacterium]MCG2703213.1 3-phosphoglycerate dehydrogenase family protein [Candidatus Omnitrophota bacterium]
MNKILTLNKIAIEGLELFPLHSYEISTETHNPEVILLRSYKMNDMDLPESLLAVGRAGAGVNNIPVDKCSEKGIVVFNTPGANANAVKELTIAGLLLSSRGIIDGVNFTRSLPGKGTEVPALVEANKKAFSGREIMGKRLAVIGLGKIGVMVANSAVDLGMQVIGYDPFISVESAWGLSRDVQRAEGLEAAILDADYITVHTPLTDKTRGVFNAEKFNIVKKGVRILNLSRGGIVNNDDLRKAIENGIVACYVTDFPDEELLSMKNVITIPHLGASTYESERNCAVMIANQVRDFVEKGNIKNSVNYPDCRLDQSTDFRLVVMHRNIPNIISQIATVLAAAGININEMLNKSKGDHACSIFDVSNKPGEDLVKAICKVESVSKVRLLCF